MRFELPEGGGVVVNAPDRASFLAAAEERLADGRGFTAATLNLDHLVKLRASARFRDAYAAMDFVTADGKPIIGLARLAGREMSVAPGSELIEPLCEIAARLGAPVALFGASPDSLDAAAQALKARFAGLDIATTLSPPQGFDPSSDEAQRWIDKLAQARPRLCFVALGAPKQEIFAARAASTLPACGFLCIGAGLDFISGAQTRAPGWVRAIAAEWVWRMMGDPRRLAGRYARCAALMPTLTAQALRRRGAPD